MKGDRLPNNGPVHKGYIQGDVMGVVDRARNGLASKVGQPQQGRISNEQLLREGLITPETYSENLQYRESALPMRREVALPSPQQGGLSADLVRRAQSSKPQMINIQGQMMTLDEARAMGVDLEDYFQRQDVTTPRGAY